MPVFRIHFIAAPSVDVTATDADDARLKGFDLAKQHRTIVTKVKLVKRG